MPSGNWSFPCSPRNPAKVREELRLFRTLTPGWRERDMPWSPRSGAQLEFGRRLRQMTGGPAATRINLTPPTDGATPPDPDAANQGPEDDLRFRTQAGQLSEDNLRWTARARYGTYKFFGFVTTDQEGFATVTPAGAELIEAVRPGETLLRQLLKWQYPDYQHRGSRWPAADFAIFPFVATSRLVLDLGGLTREEISLFCFTMRRTEDAAATAEAIRQYRQRRDRAFGRTGKARTARTSVESAQARYAAEGRRVVTASTNDYADALIRYFRYTGLFSVRGARLVIASGREDELEELVYGIPFQPPQPQASHLSARGWTASHPSSHGGGVTSSIQLTLGEAPPVRLAEPRQLFPHYEDAATFYTYYGAAGDPRLPWEDPARLATVVQRLDTQLAGLSTRDAHLRSGRTPLVGSRLGADLPADYDSLLRLADDLRREKQRLERAIFAAESHSPQRLAEALDFYATILAREVIDPPTFLEWNTWRVFLALNAAREILPHLTLDDDLQPLNAAQGNQPDLEVDYANFLAVVEVTLRTGADQRQAEARPVTRHVLEAQRRYNDPFGGRPARPVYGLFVAPRIHPDTANDFFVALKYRVIERQQINAIPLTLAQLITALRPFAGPLTFEPAHLNRLLDSFVQGALESDTGDDWLEQIDTRLRTWLAHLGAPIATPELRPRAVPLPLF